MMDDHLRYVSKAESEELISELQYHANLMMAILVISTEEVAISLN